MVALTANAADNTLQYVRSSHIIYDVLVCLTGDRLLCKESGRKQLLCALLAYKQVVLAMQRPPISHVEENWYPCGYRVGREIGCRGSRGRRKEITGKAECGPIPHFCRCTFHVLSDSGSQRKEGDRERFYSRRGRNGLEHRLEVTMEPLNHTIGLWVVGGSSGPMRAKEASEVGE